ncbi:MAG: hypothetical protein AAFN13_17315, partial [Bacteroidota bacterium]
MNLAAKSFIDYALFVGRIKWRSVLSFCIDLLLLVTATLVALADLPEGTEPLAVLLLGVAAVKVLWGGWKLLARIAFYLVHPRNTRLRKRSSVSVAEIPLRLIGPSTQEYEQGARPYQTPNGRVIYSSEVNRYLIRAAHRIRLHHTPGRINVIRQSIRARDDMSIEIMRHAFLQARRDRKVFTNDPKLCLSEGIRIGSEDLACHKGGYFDSFLTNEAAVRVVQPAVGTRTLVDGTSLFPAVYDDGPGHFRLLPIETSNLNNHIGVSTLVFSSDHFFVLWRQTPVNMINDDTLVPTGSGSADWVDYNGARNTSLGLVVRASMVREFSEESRYLFDGKPFSESDLESFMLLGTFRWVDRGGKPEFASVAKVRLPEGRIEPDRVEVDRREGEQSSL